MTARGEARLAAGLAATVLNNPLDVAKSRLQRPPGSFAKVPRPGGVAAEVRRSRHHCHERIGRQALSDYSSDGAQ
jgi:hypothetical protein